MQTYLHADNRRRFKLPRLYNINLYVSLSPCFFLAAVIPPPVYPLPCLIIEICLLCCSSYGALPHTLRGLRPSTPQPFEKRLAKTLPCVYFALIFFFAPLPLTFSYVCFVLPFYPACPFTDRLSPAAHLLFPLRSSPPHISPDLYCSHDPLLQ